MCRGRTTGNRRATGERAGGVRLGGINRWRCATGVTRGSGDGGIHFCAGERHQRGSASRSAAGIFGGLRFKVHLRLSATCRPAAAGFGHDLRGTEVHVRDSLGGGHFAFGGRGISPRQTGAGARGKLRHILRPGSRRDRPCFSLQRGARHRGLGPAAGDLSRSTGRESVSRSGFLRRLRAASCTGGNEGRTIAAGSRAVDIRRAADSRCAAGGAGQCHLGRLSGLAGAVGGSDGGRGAIHARWRCGGRGGHCRSRRCATSRELRIERRDCARL